MEIHQVGAELFYAERRRKKGKRRDMTKVIAIIFPLLSLGRLTQRPASKQGTARFPLCLECVASIWI
jgi:hypothetical protein